MEYLLSSGEAWDDFTYFDLFNSSNSLMKVGAVITPYYRWVGNKDTES